jgi:hypothetical protein
VLVLAVILATGACSGGGSRKDSSASSGPVTESGAAVVTTAPAATGSLANGSATQLGEPVSAASPRIVRRADIRVDVKHLDAAFDQATVIAQGAGGFVASSSIAHDNDGSSGALTLRVPEPQFADTLTKLGKLGKAVDRSERGDDVSGQLVDLDARIQNLQSEEEALRTLVGRTTTVGEILQVQPQLFDVRQQIEQLQAQRNELDNEATYATISLTLTEPGVPPPGRAAPKPKLRSLRDSARIAVRGLVAVLGGLLIAVAVALPFAVLGLMGLLGWRLSRRRVGGVPSVDV